MKQFLHQYASFTHRKLCAHLDTNEHDLRYWQNQLFCNFLVYCLPVSLIALIPTVFIAFKEGLAIFAFVVMLCFSTMAAITFLPNISLRNRKITALIVFYALAIFLINNLGYLWPGIFYLFFITVLSALIFPIRFAYRTVLINSVILTVFAIIIAFKLFDSVLISKYNFIRWMAASANLVFASVVIVLLIDKIFDSLQLTLAKKTQLQERYQHIFDNSPLPMWLFDTDNYGFIDVNDAAVRQYGYSRDEFMTMTIMDIRPIENMAQTATLVASNKLSGEFYGGVWQHVKKSGEVVFVKIESNLLTL